MPLEKQVTSLEISKRLKELGVKQESLFWWFESKDKHDTLLCFDSKLPNQYIYDFEKMGSAFTVAELGELIASQVPRYLEKCSWYSNGWAWYEQKMAQYHPTNTEADARGEQLIYLLENNLIKP